MQLKGTKKWYLKAANAPHPIRGCTPHYNKFGNMEQQLKMHNQSDVNFTVLPDTSTDVHEIVLNEGNLIIVLVIFIC